MKAAIPFLGAVAIFATAMSAQQGDGKHSNQVPLTFVGGYATDSRDMGRPVTLIAGALGVPANVFREAFSHVRPAPAGQEPEPEQVHRNKDALLSALGRYGVTNERLDQVSDHYRYVARRGEMWPTKAASGYAVVQGGKVQRVVITHPGYGYSSPPSVQLRGLSLPAEVNLRFDPDFARNGSISSIDLRR